MILALALLGTVASPQDFEGEEVSRIDFDKADVRDVLRILFYVMGASYVVAPEVKGTVTIHAKHILHHTVLDRALGQVRATWRIEGGVYVVQGSASAPPGLRAFARHEAEIVQGYDRIRAAAREPGLEALARELGSGFCSLSSTGEPRLGKAAATILREVERGYPERRPRIVTVEASGVDLCATFYASYVRTGKDRRHYLSYIDTWRRTDGGAWRLAARQPRL